MATPREDFLHGLKTPSISALAGAAATVYALGALCVATVGPSWLTDGNVRWLASGPEDDYAYATAAVLEMDPGDETVVILGGSGTRESLSTEADLEQALAERLGRPIDVLDMTTDAQTLIEGAGLLDEVGAPPHLLVVFGVGGHTLSTSTDDLYVPYSMPRLGFRNGVIDGEFARLGWPAARETGWPLVDNRNFYLVRLPFIPVNLLRGGTERAQHRFLGLPPLAAENIHTDWSHLLGRFRENHAMNLEILGRSVDRVRERGGRAVILEAPAWEAWFGSDEESAFYAEVHGAIARFAKDRGLPVWTLDRDAGLAHADFRDPAHLNNTDAQERYAQALVGRLAPLLSEP